jgi:hypothetical protein
VIQELESVYRIQRLEFHAGRTNQQMAALLQNLITQRTIAWYPGCGAVGDDTSETRFLEETGFLHAGAGRDDLETELAGLRLRSMPGGYERFDHRQDGVHHDDRAFVVAAAALALHSEAGAPAFWHETPPLVPGVFGW